MKKFSVLLTLLSLIGLLLPGCALKDKIFPPQSAPSGETAAAPSPTPAPTPDPTPSPPTANTLRRSVLDYAWPLNWPGMLFPKGPEAPQALPPQVVGVIKMINLADSFVLIDAVSFGNLEAGTELLCIANRKETATLQMSALKNPPFLIADIVKGHPSPGDKVIKP